MVSNVYKTVYVLQKFMIKIVVKLNIKENGVTPFSEVTPYFLKYFPIRP